MTITDTARKARRTAFLILSALLGLLIIPGHYVVMRHGAEWYVWFGSMVFFGFGMFGLQRDDVTGFADWAMKAGKALRAAAPAPADDDKPTGPGGA